MRLIVPYVRGMLRQETWLALKDCGYDVEWASMDPNDDGHYAFLIEGLWQDGEDFCVVEQDVVPTQTMLEALEQCPYPWCSHCYADPDYPRTAMLGLARFCSELLDRRTEIGLTVLRTDRTRTEHVGWRSLNETLVHHLEAHDEPWHRHLPDVTHIHRRAVPKRSVGASAR
ncbi:MAG: hypothetical protein ACYCZM_11980 [Acidimicrobiales bacterium]